MAISFADEMRLYDDAGNRLYLNSKERQDFISASKLLDKPQHRLFCEVLHWTGARLTEPLILCPRLIDIDNYSITLQTLKRRKVSKTGKPQKPQFRSIPVPKELIENLDLIFNIRKAKRTGDQALLDKLFWPNATDSKKPISRTTSWNIIKRVLLSVNINGPQACPKGLRHGFGVAMTLAGMDVFKLRDRLGHVSAETTQIYRQVVGRDDHDLQMQYWEKTDV
ncbi:site-specific integrase [Paraglaciecola sp. 20A4]|uniref:tyrosine-type recombinase/integrase n=1 Tax=Paraglaciecola sp. 20A4 TaxID=2687288 RepID=UPI00140A16AF|nr:site-specific integrase [Paraglaciecola sp. 20A4]